MKKTTPLSIIILIVLGLTFIGCKKCKECYFVQGSNGIKNETPLGEFCGDEIENKENEVFTCIDGGCYNECK